MGFLDRFIGKRAEPSIPERRLKAITTDDLALWVDNTVSQVGKSTRDFLIDGDIDHLGEARIAAESLVAMVSELERRAE